MAPTRIKRTCWPTSGTTLLLGDTSTEAEDKFASTNNVSINYWHVSTFELPMNFLCKSCFLLIISYHIYYVFNQMKFSEKIALNLNFISQLPGSSIYHIVQPIKSQLGSKRSWWPIRNWTFWLDTLLWATSRLILEYSVWWLGWLFNLLYISLLTFIIPFREGNLKISHWVLSGFICMHQICLYRAWQKSEHMKI